MASVLASVVLCTIVAQAAAIPQSGQSAAAVDHAALNRIRVGLRAPALTIPVIDERSLRYRVLVEARHLRLKVPWDGSTDTSVPSYVRPSYSQTHYEFLRMATPEAWHASTLYVGADVLGPTTSLIKTVRRSARNRQTAAIRRQIADELRQIQEANTRPQ